MAFAKSVMEYWLIREITQWVHYEGSIRRPIAPYANALPELHLAPTPFEVYSKSFISNLIILFIHL